MVAWPALYIRYKFGIAGLSANKLSSGSAAAKAVQRNSSLHARIESHGSSTPFSRAAVRPLRYPISSTIDHERRMRGRLKISHVAKRSVLASQNVVYRTLSLRPSRLQSRHSADVRLGHKRTSWHVQPISALRPIADIRIASDNLKFNHR